MEFLVTISHSQINVFDLSTPDFNDWNDEHVAQGFSWRPNHVSFGVPDHDGKCLVDISVVDHVPELSPSVLRAIRVPFDASDQVLVATVFDENELNVPRGNYSLYFWLSEGNPNRPIDPYAYKLNFFFVGGYSEDFEILRRSGEMSTDKILTTEAEPAM